MNKQYDIKTLAEKAFAGGLKYNEQPKIITASLFIFFKNSMIKMKANSKEYIEYFNKLSHFKVDLETINLTNYKEFFDDNNREIWRGLLNDDDIEKRKIMLKNKSTIKTLKLCK